MEFEEQPGSLDTQGGEPTGTPAPDPSAPTPDENLFDVPGHGRLSRDEVIKGYLRQQDYTRKTMESANREREFQTLQRQSGAMEQALRQVQAFLRDRGRLSQYLQGLPGGEPEFDPAAVMTGAEAEQLVKRKIGETEQTFQSRFQQAEERMMTAIYANQYEQAINGKLQTLGTKFPEITRVPGMELLLRKAVENAQPANIGEALSYFEQAAQYYAEQLRSVAKQTVAAPSPSTRGIEPPARQAAPMPSSEPTDFTGLKDPRLRDLVMQDIQKAMTERR